MVRPTIRKIEEVGTQAGYGKGFLALFIALLCTVGFLIHSETSKAKSQEWSKAGRVTVERIPAEEARKNGVDPRHN